MTNYHIMWYEEAETARGTTTGWRKGSPDVLFWMWQHHKTTLHHTTRIL